MLLIENPDNLAELQEIMESIIKRSYTRNKIKFLKAKSITVYGSADTDWTLDGEYAKGEEKINIRNVHKAINFIVPSET